MLRNYLLSALAAATLAGCATGYSYRNDGGGDYYYSQPRVEYRYYDPYGYYGGYGDGRYGYGGYVQGYYYDRYGRLMYGNPYGYYGYPYGYGGQSPYRPRPPRDHDGHDRDDQDDGRSHDRKPPWRNIRGALPPGEQAIPGGDDVRPRARRQPMPSMVSPAPQAEPRPAMPRMRGSEGGSRMGRAIRNAKTAAPSADE